MIEKRKFPRARLTANSTLSHHAAIYKGQMENISLSGALIRLEQCIIVPHGGEYNLSVYIEGENIPLRLIVEVVCATYELAGLKFVSCDTVTATRLGQLVEELTSEPGKLVTEQERIRIHLDNYLR